MAPFAQRRLDGELMDDPDIDPRVHAGALRGLRRINRLSRTAAVLWSRIAPIAAAHGDAPLSLLDVATGGGEVPVALVHRARNRGVALRVEACDVSRTALRCAAERADVPVRFFPLDVLSEELPKRYDVITATLFLHHLTDDRIVALLRKLAAQAGHILISDLVRSRRGYCMALLGTRLLSASEIVRVDGPRSVRAALTVPEVRALAAEAGLRGAHVRHHWPERFLLTWHAPDSGRTAA